ncbi:MAG: AmmeMemoRadiSam system radical SAM enzyme, partial [Candidatus Methylumidiphilus sp.]
MDTPINPAEAYPARFWRTLDEGRVECQICPRLCKLRAGQRGLCFVRGNVGGAVALLSYGRSSGFCIDPIEKKPLSHFLPGTPVFSFGTAGCNLACKFCQNWDISKSREMDRLMDLASPEAIARAAQHAGCRSVAYTYNDPVIFHEYAVDTALACRA